MQAQLSEKQQHQLEQVKSAMASNLTFSEYAKQHNLNAKVLYNWKSDFVRKGVLPGKAKKPFTKVVATSIIKSEPTPADSVIKAILPNGIELRFDSLSRTTLELLKAL